MRKILGAFVNWFVHKAFLPPAYVEKLSMQCCEKPTFDVLRILELVSFIRPNVEGLLGQISRVGFVSGQTQTKPIQIAVVKFHKIFKLQVGGHVAVIPKWESSAAYLFPPMQAKNNESHDYVGNKVSKKFSIG